MILKPLFKILQFRSFCYCAPLYELDGKIALITGGTLGIGFATARELLQNGVKRVCLADKNERLGKKAVNLLSNEFGVERAIFADCNLLEPCSIENAFALAIRRWGKLDIVINNAGILSDKEWENEIAINCNGVVRGTQLGFHYMSQEYGGRGGVIVNVSSILGLDVCNAVPVYIGTKHFVLGYSRSLGRPFTFNKSGVRVLIMCPGVTLTDLVNNAHKVQASDDLNYEIHSELKSLPPQPVECVSKGIVYMIQRGVSGSVWVSEAAQHVYEIAIPDRRGFRKKKC